MRIIRQFYDWTLHWAATPYAVWALAAVAFVESSFFPVPPDVLLIALCVSARKKAFQYAFLCVLGSLAGGLFGYYIGHELWYTHGEFSKFANLMFTYIPGFHEEIFYHVKNMYEQNAFWIIFSVGFTPIPYKIFTIAAGVSQIDLPLFLLASALSRGLRFFLVAGILYRFGESIRLWIERYFNLLTILLTVLILLGFGICKLLAGT